MGGDFRLAIFDLDGTLFRGNEPIPGAVEATNRLRDAGILIRYLTNNSSQTRETYTEKLTRMGFTASPDEIYSSAIGTAAFLNSQNLMTAFVVGEAGLRDTLNRSGIEEREANPAAVVVGICKSFDYSMMGRAMKHIRSGSKFVATNTDPTYPVEGGEFIPGSGSIVAAVATCSETAPFVVGKPNPFLVELILEDSKVSPEYALVIGDRMDTDIESGRRAGCRTLLVLTGAASEAPSGQDWLPSVADLKI